MVGHTDICEFPPGSYMKSNCGSIFVKVSNNETLAGAGWAGGEPALDLFYAQYGEMTRSKEPYVRV